LVECLCLFSQREGSRIDARGRFFDSKAGRVLVLNDPAAGLSGAWCRNAARAARGRPCGRSSSLLPTPRSAAGLALVYSCIPVQLNFSCHSCDHINDSCNSCEINSLTPCGHRCGHSCGEAPATPQDIPTEQKKVLKF